MSIPKVIHSCWFGRNPKPKLESRCVASWKEKCPDYEIIEWNEDNFKIEEAPLFVRQAYEAKKWAFVADYVRLYVLVHCGGIYLDTDVELVNSFDRFLQNQAFTGSTGRGESIETGVLACEKGFPFFEELLHYYDKIPFLKEDGSYDMTSNNRIMVTAFLEKGMRQDNSFQVIENCAVYPSEVFSPRDWASGKVRKTKDTVSIHWISSSWFTPEKRKQIRKIRAKIRWKNRVHFLKHLPNFILLSLLGEANYNHLKKIIRGG